MKRINIIGIVLLLVVVFSSSAYLVSEQYTTQWITGNSIETVTMDGISNETLYISLPKYADVTYGNINLTTTDSLELFGLYVDKNLIYASNVISVDDTVAYYTFDEDNISGATLIDIANQEYNGTISGSVLSSIAVLNTSHDFESVDSDFIEVSTLPDDVFANNFTISTWAKFESTSSNMAIFSAGSSAVGNQYINLGFNTAGNTIQFEYSATGTATCNSLNSFAGNDSWNYITAKGYDNGTIELYINGIIQCSATGHTPESMTRNNIGQLYEVGVCAGCNFYDGLIDEMSIYNKTLSTAEIEALYNSGNGINPYSSLTLGTFNGSTIITNFDDEIDTYLNGCTANANGTCNVPFVFSSNSSGSLTAELLNITANRYYNNFSFTAQDTGLSLSPTCYLDGDLWNYTSGNSWLVTNLRNLSCTRGGYSSYSDNIYFVNATETITLQPHNLNIIFKDEETGSVLNGITITVGLISDNYATNFTTSTGTYAINLTVPDDYTIRYQADLYGKLREYYFTLTTQSVTNLTLYLLNDTSSTDTTVTVYDSTTLLEIPSAYVYLMRYDTLTNTYTTVAEYKTDIAGKSYFDVEHDNELYKFMVEYPKGTIRLTTDPLYISTANINLYISLTTDPTEAFFQWGSITGLPEYSADSNTFDVTYNDPSFVATYYCFQIKTYGQYSTEIINSTCSSSPSGSMSLGGMTLNTTYYAVFSAIIDGEEVVIGTAWKEFLSSELGAGGLGLFLTAFIIILMAFLSTVHIYALILSSMGLLFSKFLGIIDLSWGTIIVVVIGAIILGMIIQMKK